MNNEPLLRPAPSLQEIHATLRALYNSEYPTGSHVPLSEMLLSRLPPDMQLLVAQQPNLLLRFHSFVGRDAALSNERNSIAHFETQQPIIAHRLISAAAGGDPTPLERMGCVFFDVDGTKTVVDCTSHARAGKYLEELAAFLCNLPTPIQQWLQERSLHTETYSSAGDEFIVLVHSSMQTVHKKTLDAFALEVQNAIAKDQHLASFISFDDPAFIMEYDEWTDADRAIFSRDPASMQEKMKDSRRKLPDSFTPSVSCGSATFLEALQEALSPDTEEAKTLEELGVNAFHLMVSSAGSRMKEDKHTFRKNMADHKWKTFLLRNAENRRLMNEIDDLRQKLSAIVERYA